MSEIPPSLRAAEDKAARVTPVSLPKSAGNQPTVPPKAVAKPAQTQTHRADAVLGPGDSGVHLMLRVGADEPGAFEELVGRYRPRLRGVLHRLVGNDGDVDSLVQEVFLRVYRARRRYRAQAQLSTWLFTIAKNLANNTRRRQLTVRVFTEGRDADGDRPVRQLLDVAAHQPLEQLEQEELATMVRQAVDGLKERQRRVIVLNKFEGLDYAEVARIEGLTPQAVKSLLSRARANLRRALQGYIDQGSQGLPTAVVSG